MLPSMNTWLLLITGFTLVVWLLRSGVDLLNLRRARQSSVPEEFRDLVDEEKFSQASAYQAAQTTFSLFRSTLWCALSLVFLWEKGFGLVDLWARGLTSKPLLISLLYFLGLALLAELFSLPFSWFHTFRLEERFGFNRSRWTTFLADQVKGWLLGILLGGPILAGVLWLFSLGGSVAWLWAWAFLSAVQILLVFLAPVVLMPLFNRFTPLPEGELREAILAFAEQVRFRLQGIFTMDGSKRSAKANAFFTGLGRFRRIVLFDTLVNKHSVPELVAVLAHEVGHYKRGHIVKNIFFSLASSFVLFWLLAKVLQLTELTQAIGFNEPSLHAGFTAAAWVYVPLAFVLDFVVQAFSRKYEFEADAFAAQTTKDPQSLITALKKLSVDNLSDLDPHPWKVLLEYSHPPVVQRIRTLATFPQQ